ncbi:uncharacterized protein NPIL_571371 [Nephila pilipes]|uniref:Nucleotide exchange factor SIL1 n=1 Tax=Nephila pilipes TaxID=299642 RepID=A0A8X6UVA1_NEPPI|nr:uncharacterized protein NPIL_571371 [Nephila pilipes]
MAYIYRECGKKKKKNLDKSKEGDFEYRRSLVRKISLATKSQTLKEWMKSFQNNEYSVEVLRELEYLVHQYETASDFVKLGGLELILPLVNHEDPSLASSALAVLSAALQGNPPVQKYAEEVNIVDYLIIALTKGPHTILSSALFTLSSYLRNNEESQIKFFRKDGLRILADILKSQIESLKSKLKVIDLLNDLATEIYGSLNIVDKAESSQLQRIIFYNEFKKTNICEKISTLLKYYDNTILEKTVAAMDSLHHICLKEFSKKHAIASIERHLGLYNPNAKKTWYFTNDLEMRRNIWNALRILHEKIMSAKFIKTEL